MRQQRLFIFLIVASCQVAMAETSNTPPVIPVGYDAYRMWDQWPYQRIGARAYMRSTYDRTGGNETADASHFLYQTSDDFNVTLDVEGPGILYFARYNHWHGSPWHYEVDGADHIVQETTTADPSRKLDNSVFIPERAFPKPLAWTYAITKGADLSWVPVGFKDRFRMAYSRTFYGTGYYIYHHYLPGAPLSQAIEAWTPNTFPPADVIDLINRSGSDIAPAVTGTGPDEKGIAEQRGLTKVSKGKYTEIAYLNSGPSMIRALSFSVPREKAIEFGRGRIRITWDDRPAPSIEGPIALFFGAGTLYNRDNKSNLVQSLPMNIRFDEDRVNLACYFPMPFFQSARIELMGPDGTAIDDVRWALRTQPFTGPANHVAYFHATYADHPAPELGEDMVFLDTLDAEGSGEWTGSFVGTSFIFSENAILHTLEGDPRFFFDDSKSPQAYGTGTEEWGGGGDYWGGRTMSLPFAGHPVGVARGEQPRNAEDLIHSAYRFLLADLMPFGKRALIRFEHGAINQTTEHYQSITYWYGLPGASLVLTDELDIGDITSEKQHGYQSPDASEPCDLNSRYEWGPDHVSESDRIAPLSTPGHYAEYEFEADANKRYTIWARGKSDGNFRINSSWIQFDETIGTSQLGSTYRDISGLGNWSADENGYSWASARVDQPPHTVEFSRSGKHHLRVQLKRAPHLLDQIWLSATQQTKPEDTAPVPKTGNRDQIILDTTDLTQVAGDFRIHEDSESSTGKVLQIAGSNESKAIEVYPEHTETGRTTKTSSRFRIKLQVNNLGAMLRRTLDYQYPNQRARVFIADGKIAEPANDDWQDAGVWYLAGSNTCYWSYPRQAGELGKTNPVVQTSNRRFRDDEFLVARRFTESRDSIHVRVDFTPTNIPLLPERELDGQAWSEIRYKAYCFVMPPDPILKPEL